MSNYWALVENIGVDSQRSYCVARYYAATYDACERERVRSWHSPHRITLIIAVSQADYDAQTECPSGLDDNE